MLLTRSYVNHFRQVTKNIYHIYCLPGKPGNTQFMEYLLPYETTSEGCYIGRRFLQTVAIVQNRTSRLLDLLQNAKNDNSRLVRLEELNEHLLRYFLFEV